MRKKINRDIHKKPFDEGTKAKLSIFQDYLKEWLPVFLARKESIWKIINIFDFFAGPGSDSNGYKGTPLTIIEELSPYLDKIINKSLRVNLYFNEYSKSKQEQLESKLLSEVNTKPFTIKIDNLDFKDSFNSQFQKMNDNNCANLLFLDQTGIKHIGEDVFGKIINLKTTDFLFFVSSSTIKRFSEHPNIAQHIRLNPQQVENTPYHKIHRLILDYYRSLVPMEKQYYLASFSLRKNSGVYGLIFGSGHVLGIEKFLTTCWNIDQERGEANFDIDDDRIVKGQFDLFTGAVRKPKKVDLFEKELQEKILNKELSNDKEIYLFTLTNGFIPAHARKVIANLVSEKKIHKQRLDLSSKICRKNASITEIKIT